ncbi:proline racemase family protein [Virgibacillus sediminis]|uniref:Proline racemase family protein n=1 Tax=Virgibacillus sediminis TaxID=202260 RepID=A0ABV7A3Q1_9BACI
MYISEKMKTESNKGIMKITTLDTHTGGDPTRIVTDGLPEIIGDTMIEKKRYLIDHYDNIRTSLMHEPRGHRDMFGAILLEPTSPTADIGVVFMDTGGYLNMCGHGTIGVVTAIIESGIVDKSGNEIELVLDTPAGLVEIKARMKEDKVTSVSLKNVPSFSWIKDKRVTISGIGEIHVDVSFGGSFYVFVNPRELNIDLIPANADRLRSLGMLIKEEVNKQIPVQHPTVEDINTIDLVLFLDKSDTEGVNTRNVAVFGESNVARSACGTGLSAQMAAIYNSKLSLNETYVTESFIGTTMRGVLVEEVKLENKVGVIPIITGDAVVTGQHEFYIDRRDSLSRGFLLD